MTRCQCPAYMGMACGTVPLFVAQLSGQVGQLMADIPFCSTSFVVLLTDAFGYLYFIFMMVLPFEYL